MTSRFWTNEADAFDLNQAEPDSVDMDILLLGFQQTGVVSGCAVSESSPAAQTIDVAVGVVAIDNSQIAVSAQADVAVTAADGSNPRIDLITVNSSGTVVVTAGTAAAQPVAPTLPDPSVALAYLSVPASDNTHQDAQISDKRVLLINPPPVEERYVDAATGLSTNDGLSWASAFDTIQAAHDDLPTGALSQGGTIYVNRVITETDVIITKDGVNIIGTGRNATRWDILTTGDDIGLIIRGDRCVIEKIAFRGSATLRTGAIWIDGAEFTSIRDVFFNRFGSTVAAGDTLQAGAFGVFASGGTNAGEGPFGRTGTGVFSDWTTIIASQFFQCYRGLVVAGGANGRCIATTFRTNTENGTLIRRKELGSGGGVSWRFIACWWTTGRDGDYMVRLEVDVGESIHNTNCNFVGCTTEGLSGTGVHHFHCDGASNSWIGHAFSGGGDAGETPIAIDYTVDAIDNHLGPYRAVSQGSFGIPAVVDLGTDNRDDGRVPKGRYRSAQEVAAAITLDSNMAVVNVDSSAAPVVVTVPDNADFSGIGWLVRRDGANTVTINLSGADTFSDGDTTKTLDSDDPGAAIGFFSIGDAEYKIVATEGTVGGS